MLVGAAVCPSATPERLYHRFARASLGFTGGCHAERVLSRNYRNGARAFSYRDRLFTVDETPTEPPKRKRKK